MIASEYSRVEIAKVLLQAGAHFDVKNKVRAAFPYCGPAPDPVRFCPPRSHLPWRPWVDGFVQLTHTASELADWYGNKSVLGILSDAQRGIISS